MQALTLFADISMFELGLIAAFAICTSVIGGVAGYGAGALLPLVLVPIVGPEPVVPIIAVSALFTNTSRVAVFRAAVDWRRALLVIALALPTSALGAYGYARLTGRGALIVIGTMMVASIPLRRGLMRRGLRLGGRGLAAAAFGWGGIVGGTSGAGIILLSMLMAAGLQGTAVIATDAAVSVAISLVKIAVFGSFGALEPRHVAVALLVGAVSFPGAFLAKAIIARLPFSLHTKILDAVVVVGGLLMIAGALYR
ncbi:MAG: sulfite exporter TauE/SafE family protein [Proteobacteria bacterium]|nr:sulfite exporter TauE/SafE family protein [Pseudomonadota bacterium]